MKGASRKVAGATRALGTASRARAAAKPLAKFGTTIR